MTNSTETFWDINGTSLQTLAYNIETWGGDKQGVPPLRGDDITIPFATGDMWVPKVVGSRTISFGMWVVGANEDGSIPSSGSSRAVFEKNWNTLRKLFWNPGKQVTLTKRFRDDVTGEIVVASAKAEFAGGLAPTMNGSQRAVFTVQMSLADPFFYGEEEQVTLRAVDPRGTNYVINPSPQATVDGWRVDGNTALVTRASGKGVAGNYGVQIQFTGEVEKPYGGVSFGRKNQKDIPVVVGEVLQTNMQVKSEKNNSLYPWIEFYDSSGLTIGTRVSGVEVSVLANAWTNFKIPTVTVPVGTSTAAIGVSVGASGTRYVQNSTNITTNPSFEASSGSTDVYTNYVTNPRLVAGTTPVEVYRNLFTNPRFVSSGTPVEVYRNLFTNPNLVGSGMRSEAIRTNYSPNPLIVNTNGYVGNRVTPSASGGILTGTVIEVGYFPRNSLHPSGSFQLAPGDTVTASWDIVDGSVPMRARIQFFSDAAGTTATGPIVETPLVGTGRLVASAIAPANALTVRVESGCADNTPAGQVYKFTKPMVLKNDQSPLAFFAPGLTSYDPDLAPSWVGSANASASILTGEKTLGLEGSGCVAIVSQKDGRPASRVIPLSADNFTYVVATLPTAARGGGTLLGTARLEGPLTGSLYSDTRVLRIQDPLTRSNVAPNSAGAHPLRVKYPELTGANQMRLFHGGARGSGDLWWTDIGLFAGDYTGPLFSGSSINVDPDMTASWTGATDNSASILSGVGVSKIGGGAGRAIIRSTSWSGISGASIRVIPLSTSPNGGATVTLTNIAVGESFTVMAKVRLTAPLTGTQHATGRRIIYGDNLDSPIAQSNQALNEAGETLLRLTSVKADAGSSVRLIHGGLEGSGLVQFAEVIVVKGNYTGPFFNGALNTDPDFTASWVGAEDNSESIVTGLPIPGFTGVNAVVVKSSKFGGSIRVIPNSELTSSSCRVAVPSDARVSGTAIGTVNLITSQVGTLDVRARMIRVSDPNHSSTQPTNTPGSTSLRVNYSNLISAYVVDLFNGASKGNGDVYWTIPGLFNDNYAGEGFSGSTTNAGDFRYLWSGTQDASYSTMRADLVTGVVKDPSVPSVAIRSNEWSSEGTYSVRLLRVGSANAYNYINVSLKPGTKYTVMLTRRVKTEGSVTGNVVIQEGSGSFRIMATLFTTGAVAAGVETSRVVFTTLSDVTVNSRIVMRPSSLVGESIWYDLVTVVEGDYSGPPFSGSTSGASWNGTANASASFRAGDIIYADQAMVTQSDYAGGYFDGSQEAGKEVISRNLFTNPNLLGSGVRSAAIRTNLIINPAPTSQSSWLEIGGGIVTFSDDALTVTCPGVSGNEGVSCITNTRPAEALSAGVEVKAPLGAIMYIATRPNGTVASQKQKSFTGTGEWQRVTVTQSDVGAQSGGHTFMVRTANQVQALTFQIRKAIMEVAPVVGSYFDGTSQSVFDPDLTPSWTGAANASISVLTGESVRGISSSLSVAIVSKKNGKPAIRHIPTAVGSVTAPVDSFIRYITIPEAAKASGTSMATIHLDSPMNLSETSSTRTREIDIYTPQQRSPKASKEAGSTVLRLQYTSLVSTYEARLYHGGAQGSGDIWWTDIGLFAGNYEGEVFSGDTPSNQYVTYEWDGTPNNSTSSALNPRALFFWNGTPYASTSTVGDDAVDPTEVEILGDYNTHDINFTVNAPLSSFELANDDVTMSLGTGVEEGTVDIDVKNFRAYKGSQNINGYVDSVGNPYWFELVRGTNNILLNANGLGTIIMKYKPAYL